ncbi:MAG: type I-E CRISPR-associated protein Cas6/Cse3/CasE [Proteobacteria bacterium]|nr:type I-E CRISPR-associated protein Cas6/Cse3/CasE [Pseudomonadota bacterium]
MIRVPIRSIVGPYGAHKIVYEAATCARPLWRRYSDHALVLAEEPSQIHPSKPYDPSPVTGMTVRFDLLANISVDKPVPDGRSRRIDPVLQAWIDSGKKAQWQSLGFEVGCKWIEDRQERIGFRLIQVDLADYEVMEFMRSGKPVRLGTIAYSGTMEIMESDKFKEAMLNGIGHGRAWGCGLLLCKRI